MDRKSFGQKGATPEAEDRALFKTYGGPIEVELVPRSSKPGKFLYLAKGFFEKDREIIVVFSGRRASETDTLERYLKQIETAAHQRAVARRVPPPDPDKIRLPVQIKGAWEYQVHHDPDGEDVKVFQLIAARWAFTDGSGQLHQFGESPAFDMTTRRRNKSYILQTREIDAVPRASRLDRLQE